MAFRDETEALRARVGVLERELAAAESARERLEARVRELEAPPRPEPEPTRDRAPGGAGPSVPSRILSAMGTVGGIALLVAIPVGLAIAGQVLCESSSGCSGGLDASAAPSVGLVDLDATPDPAELQLTTSGSSSAPIDCRGYVPDAPQVVLRTAYPTAIRVAPVASSGDLVAVVQLPDGSVRCDDDGGGSLNPLIATVIPPGDTRVWIGTYSEDESIDFRFVIHAERDPSLADPRPAMVLDGPGPEARVALPGEARAVEPASQYDPACRGFVPVAPALTLRLARSAAVHLEARGSEDLVLLVREPDGHVKCDDDSGPGNAPRVATVLVAGEHQVFVGTYSQPDGAVPFVLEASAHEIDPAAAPLLGTRALAAPGDVITVEGTSAGEVGPSAIGAACGGGLVGTAPALALEVARPGDVVLALSSNAQPFLVVQHPDRAIECVREPHARVVWAPGTHRIYVGVADDSEPGAFTLTARLEPPTIQPWRAP